MPFLLAFSILLLVSIISFIAGHVIKELFGDQIVNRVKKLLPEGVQTDKGTVTK